MDEHERYLFDLQGYITIPNALSTEILDEFNAVLDQRVEGAVEPDVSFHAFPDVLVGGQPYLDLIDLPTVNGRLFRVRMPEITGSKKGEPGEIRTHDPRIKSLMQTVRYRP